MAARAMGKITRSLYAALLTKALVLWQAALVGLQRKYAITFFKRCRYQRRFSIWLINHALHGTPNDYPANRTFYGQPQTAYIGMQNTTT